MSLQQPLRGGKQLSIETILTNYPKIFDDSVGKVESTLHLYTKDDVTPHKKG